MALRISRAVREKLTNRHGVTEEEVEQCFANQICGPLIDTRAEHRSNPITRWFISETDVGRKLKIAYMPIGGDVVIKTAYEPNAAEIAIYEKFAKPLT